MENIEQAISNANLARKYAKQRKHEYGHSCLTYDPAMAFELKRKAEYISDMKKGIESGEFFLEYQPIVMTDTLDLIGAEALIRWKKDNYNRLMPDDFIPIFEKDGCIVKMDYYVYDQVFSFVSERMKEGKAIVPISLNVSIVHFYEDKLIGYIDSLREKYKIDTSLINFDIDERIAVRVTELVYDPFGHIAILDVLAGIPGNTAQYRAAQFGTVRQVDRTAITAISCQKAQDNLGGYFLRRTEESAEPVVIDRTRFFKRRDGLFSQGFPGLVPFVKTGLAVKVVHGNQHSLFLLRRPTVKTGIAPFDKIGIEGNRTFFRDDQMQAIGRDGIIAQTLPIVLFCE